MNLKFEYITVNQEMGTSDPEKLEKRGTIFFTKIGMGMGVVEKLKAEVDSMKDICNCFMVIKVINYARFCDILPYSLGYLKCAAY